MTREEIIQKVSSHLSTDVVEAEMIIDKAIIGGETTEEELESWLNNRFLPNVVFIDEDGYARMCIDALKIVGTTAASDYGSSRQRDLGQLWADMTRGYIGELAFKIFLKQNEIDIELGHEAGELSEYLPNDIHKVKKDKEEFREPKIKVGIKATKWNGIWFDIPGDQFNHSDFHVLVKVGTGRDHLFAYFKKISVFKDKVLKVGQDIGLLSGDEANTLYNNLPTFKPISAYIAGFVKKDEKYDDLPYKGKSGRLNYKITEWNGQIKPGDLEIIKDKEKVKGKIAFEGIGSFAHDSGYLFNTGNLKWGKKDWKEVMEGL